jgi:hypothetical protein
MHTYNIPLLERKLRSQNNISKQLKYRALQATEEFTYERVELFHFRLRAQTVD